MSINGSLSRTQQVGLSHPETDAAPLERKAQRIHGRLFHDDEGGYRLEGSQGPHTLITLEPAVERCLRRLDESAPVDLIAVENPWGSWWRVIRVLDQRN